MSGSVLFTELRFEPMHVKMAYLIGEQRKNFSDTSWRGKPIKKNQFITSRYHLMEMGSMTERQARFAMTRLVDLGLWIVEPEGRKFSRITVSTKVLEKVLENVPENVSKIQSEVENDVPEKVLEKVHRDVDVNHALSHASDVDVSPALDIIKNKPLARVRACVGPPDDTAWLAPESQRPTETAASNGPPPPIDEFQDWVKDQIPRWVKSKAREVWSYPEDKAALASIFQVRALFEIQACWQLFTRAGTKSYDYASKQRFSMREFRRQIEFLVNEDDYRALKNDFMKRDAPVLAGTS